MHVTNWLHFFGFLLLLAAMLAAAGFGVAMLVRYRRLRKRGVRTTGRIADFECTDEHEQLYAPVVAYETATGRKLMEVYFTATTRKPRIGKEVEILYDPERPETFEFLRSETPLAAAVFLLVFGGAGVLVALELLKLVRFD